MSFILLGILNSQALGAAAAAGAYELVQTEILPSAQASITFDISGLTDYQHLQIRYVGQSVLAGNTGLDDLQIRFNSSSDRYRTHVLRGTGGAPISGSYNLSYINLAQALSRSGSANVYSAGVLDILDFNSSNKKAVIRGLIGSVSSTEKHIGLHSGLWIDNGALTSIQFSQPNGRNLNTLSRFSIYGLRSE